MWPDSVFAVPVGSFQSPIPIIDKDPTTGPFFYVKVSQQWMNAVQGCLLQLILQTTWDTNDPATLNLAQMRAMSLLQLFTITTDQCPDDGKPVVIVESEYEMSLCEQLRFQDGKLQALCCGTWTDIAGQTPGLTTGGPTQPGGGLPQPQPGGGCQNYHGDMRASEGWNAPTGVSAGDIITVTATSGAASDAGFSRWTCPDGSSFFLGSCIGDTGSTDPSDPLPTTKHGALIVLINGVYYDPVSPITVPTGVSNVPLIFQRNAATLTGASGDYAFDFTVCNNQAGTFTHTFDFALSPSGFVNIINSSQTPDTQGAWTGGTGWTSTNSVVTGTGSDTNGIDIHIHLATPVTLNTATLTYSLTKGSIITGLTNGLYLDLAGANIAVATAASDTDPDGASKMFVIPPGTYSIDDIEFVLHTSFFTGGGTPGSGAALQLIVTGQGADPF